MTDSEIYVSSLQHRLPTMSAFEALKSSAEVSFISSSISALDEVFGGNGFRTGQITEITGPPGSGKTAMALQATVNCIKKQEKILWIETFQPFPMHFFERVMMQEQKNRMMALDRFNKELDPLEYLNVIYAPTLNNLAALFLHSYQTESKDLIQQSKLIIIDDLATPVIAAFPTDNVQNSKNITHDSNYLKKSQILANLLLSLNRIAAKNNASILVLSKMTTKISHLNGKEHAILSSPLSPAWSHNCPNKILLLRKSVRLFKNINDLWNTTQIRFISIQKVGGVTVNSYENLIPFIITNTGISGIIEDTDNVIYTYDQTKDYIYNINETDYNDYN